MKRHLLTTLVLFFVSMMTFAQADTQRLVLWQKSGDKVYFDLTEEPETTFENGQLVIKTSKTTAYYLLENVLRYTFEGAMTAIDGPKLKPGEVRFQQGSDQMAFDGLPDGTTLEVYSLDGKKLFTKQALGGQHTVLSLASHPAGTYIVKVGDATYKFMKR